MKQVIVNVLNDFFHIEHCVNSCSHMVKQNLVNIGSGNGLVSLGINWTHDDLSPVKSDENHLWSIS